MKVLIWMMFLYLSMEKRFGKKINICTVEESLEKLAESNKSLARFGDGEFAVIHGGEIGFQDKNGELGDRLNYVLSHPVENCFIAVPDAINNYDNLTEESFTFWVKNMVRHRREWMKVLSEEETYLSTNMTRLYIRYKNKENCGKNFLRLMNVWKDKDILLVEGKATALGVGNDLLNTANSVIRIICPPNNAFEKYDLILETVKKYAKGRLILLALGPTATVLAYDLALLGYRALDVGHCDVEYEWYLQGTDFKVAIKNKYVNEVKNGDRTEVINDEFYRKQIVEEIV